MNNLPLVRVVEPGIPCKVKSWILNIILLRKIIDHFLKNQALRSFEPKIKFEASFMDFAMDQCLPSDARQSHSLGADWIVK